MPQTKAIYYRDKCGVEPVKRAAKIDDYVEEHLNGKSPEAPPPEYPWPAARR